MAEKLNGPGFGLRMAAAQQQERVARDAALRELLADLERWAAELGPADPEGGAHAYTAGRLRKILGSSQ